MHIGRFVAAGVAVCTSAAPANADVTIKYYCEGSPPVNVQTSVVYVSRANIARFPTDDTGEAVRQATSLFRERIEREYHQPIGATCHTDGNLDNLNSARRRFVEHRRANGFTAIEVPW